MKKIIYTRVSTIKQAEKQTSIKTQIDTILRTSKINDPIIIKDEGYSGTLMSRPGLNKLINLILEKKVEAIYLFDLNRLSRNLTLTVMLFDLFREHNIKLYEIDKMLDINNPNELLGLNLLNVINSHEPLKVSYMVKKNYVNALEQNKYPFGGKLPLGISKDKDKNLYYNEDKNIVVDIFELSKEYSAEKLTKILRNKYPSIRWYKNKINLILNNSLYCGIYNYNYNDKVYKLFDKPLIDIKIYKKLQIYRSNISKSKKEKYIYKFKNKLYINGILCTTTCAHGKGGLYKYYKYKDKITNEDKLYQYISNVINDSEKEKYYIKFKIEQRKFLSTLLDSNLNESDLLLKIIEFKKNNVERKYNINLDTIEKIEINTNDNNDIKLKIHYINNIKKEYSIKKEA